MSEDVQEAPSTDATNEALHDRAAEVIPPGATTLEMLVAEYRALLSRFPPPDAKEQWADANWVSANISTPAFDPYRGKFVAVADKQIRATGDTDLAATVAGAKDYKCHPARLFVCYVDLQDDWL
jgi:hypothetical protein